jgi:hypothetical protein
MKAEEKKARFNSWWMAGLSVLVSASCLYFEDLCGSALNQSQSSVYMVVQLREIKTAIAADRQHSEQADLRALLAEAEEMQGSIQKRAGNLFNRLLSLRDWAFLLALALAIGAFFGQPKSAGWISLFIGLCTVAFCCQWWLS